MYKMYVNTNQKSYLRLTLIKGALEENIQLLFKTILHHDALS